MVCMEFWIGEINLDIDPGNIQLYRSIGNICTESKNNNSWTSHTITFWRKTVVGSFLSPAFGMLIIKIISAPSHILLIWIEGFHGQHVIFEGTLSRVKKKNHCMLGGGGDANFQNQGLPLKTISFPSKMPCWQPYSNFVWHLKMLDLRCQWFWCVESYTRRSRCWRPIHHQRLLKSG